MKQITITVPDNCELKQNGNTYIVVEKEKKLTYEDIARELFFNKKGFYINTHGDIVVSGFDVATCYEDNNCISQKQAKKLLAINKLMNVAKYLNGDWQPDWTNSFDDKWFVYFSNGYKKLNIERVSSMQQHFIYFKSNELVQQAIEILGEETIKLALCTDY